MDDDQIVIPFLKWAGGKRWLISSQSSLFPTSYKRYIEPFLGSGAVFFYLRPKNAVLSDTNKYLIDTYVALRDDWKRVVKELKKHHRKHSKSYYYAVRNTNLRSPISRAARFIYLNRTCWNGLYRVNLQGNFNVPIGTKSNVLLDSDEFRQIAQLLRPTIILQSDFEPIIATADADDFIFVDPPYTVKHNFNNFIKYNEKLFSWDDQIRLKYCLVKAKERGAKIIITNAYHKSIRDLYSDFGELMSVKRQSIIAANSANRKLCEELIIRA